MKITDTVSINKNRAGQLWHTIRGEKKWMCDTDVELISIVAEIYKVAKQKKMSEYDKSKLIQDRLNEYRKILLTKYSEEIADENKLLEEKQKLAIQGIMNFFTEFEFEPNFRFVNTLARIAYSNIDNAKSYIAQYFELTDKPYHAELVSKLESREFNEIIKTLAEQKPSKQINSRLKVYYGSQGTGKTTQALEETNNVVMVCHSAMLPSDLMEDFKFIDGKATFIPSALQNAMVNGTKITLDEINLLPFESLRFLQSMLDGKEQFEYKGKTINIKNGFQIIGTMNLTVNGATFALPEPLVDRCEAIRKYKLTADNLMEALK